MKHRPKAAPASSACALFLLTCGCAASGTIGAEWGDASVQVSGQIGIPESNAGASAARAKPVIRTDNFVKAEQLKERLEGDIERLSAGGRATADERTGKQQLLDSVIELKSLIMP